MARNSGQRLSFLFLDTILPKHAALLRDKGRLVLYGRHDNLALAMRKIRGAERKPFDN